MSREFILYGFLDAIVVHFFSPLYTQLEIAASLVRLICGLSPYLPIAGSGLSAQPPRYWRCLPLPFCLFLFGSPPFLAVGHLSSPIFPPHTSFVEYVSFPRASVFPISASGRFLFLPLGISLVPPLCAGSHLLFLSSFFLVLFMPPHLASDQ